MRWTITTPADFAFEGAVCSHGFFMLAPNAWAPASRTLHTVVTLGDRRAARVSIRQTGPNRLSVQAPDSSSASHRDRLNRAVRRMLRLDEDLTPFHDRCRRSTTHSPAAEARFGRLLRSASFFEDAVKVICTCNVAWRQTVAMVDRLVAHWGVETPGGQGRGFPTPARLAAASQVELRTRGRVGYRANFIHSLAEQVATRSLDPTTFERFDRPSEDRFRLLKDLPGVGDYAAGHLCMLLGDYSRLPVDTEMIRFFRLRYPRRRRTPAAIRAAYHAWDPYQCLAYWYELWSDYTNRHGPSAGWTPDEVGRRITDG